MNFPSSLYLHIPFCRRKCFYCDFAITTGGQNLMTEYVEVLCQEISDTGKMIKPDHPELKTIFFGGGTPSLFSPQNIDRILTEVKQYWQLDDHCEISLEANPGTVTVQSLQEYPVNRISLGAQAFQEHLLDRCGRGHGVEEIFTAVDDIKQAGYTNFNLDLIAGLPDQTLSDWQESLKITIGLAPNHISVYDLTIEPDTAFGRRYQAGQGPLPTELATVEMYKTAHELLTRAGYKHYEISNYAQAGYQCQHNLTYWHNRSFYGFGMGATSYVNHQRFDRPRKMRPYLDMVKTQTYPQSIPIVSEKERLFDTLMQGLRLEAGISLTDLHQQFDRFLIEQVCNQLESYTDRGWVEMNGVIRLIPLDGWIFSDVIISDLYNFLTND